MLIYIYIQYTYIYICSISVFDSKFNITAGGTTRAISSDLRSRLSSDDLEALRDTLRIGLHEEVQVTATAWGAKRLATDEQRLGKNLVMEFR